MTIAPLAGGGAGITSDGTRLFWTQFDPGGGVISSALDGGGATTLASDPWPAALAADGTAVYWTQWSGGQPDRGLQKVNYDGTGLTTLSPPGLLLSVAADASYVYWTQYDTLDANAAGPDATGSVFRANKYGTGRVALASGVPAPNGIAVDATTVYWTVTNGQAFPGYPSIAKCAIGGCGGVPTAIATGQTGPFAIAVDAANVYFTNIGNSTNDGSVMKLQK
jgi:hypothetical protein